MESISATQGRKKGCGKGKRKSVFHQPVRAVLKEEAPADTTTMVKEAEPEVNKIVEVMSETPTMMKDVDLAINDIAEVTSETSTMVKDVEPAINAIAEVSSETATMVKDAEPEIGDIVESDPFEISTGKAFFVPISYKVILNALIEELYLPPPIFTSEKYGCDHSPVFVSKVEFKVGEEKIALLGKKAGTRKRAEQDAALQAIMHLKSHFAIVLSQDVNFLNLFETVAEYEGLQAKHEELETKYEDAIVKLQKMKIAIDDHLSSIHNV